jgi:membrane-associated phospholipid phosphatase
VVAAAAAWQRNRVVGTVLYAWAVVVWVAVVYLGEHYVADILIGDALAVFMWWLSGRIFPVGPYPAQPRERAISDSIS